MTTPTDADLKPFGWAPGHYTVACDCVAGNPAARLDKTGAKRCSRCRECAEAAWREAGGVSPATPSERARVEWATAIHGAVKEALGVEMLEDDVVLGFIEGLRKRGYEVRRTACSVG